MAEIFLSYAEQDSEVAAQLETAFRQSGLAIAPAHSPQQPPGMKRVARELTAAKCVIVLWSDHAAQNELILAEADYARSRDIVVSAVIGNPPLPVGFRDVFFANLTHWTGAPDGEPFMALKRLVDARIDPDNARELPRIFLCYRREDSQGEAGRLYDRLTDSFGPDRVFMDIDSVPLGIDFVDHVKEQITRCRAVIVMIGRQWLTVPDKRGARRLDDPEDLVRIEVATALQQKVPVIPVLVQNASMPDREELPAELRLLTRRNGIALRHDQWREGVARLLKELDALMTDRA